MSSQLPPSQLKVKLGSGIATSAGAERGFTLIELMIAMTIFALLAVAGWQIFDGLNRAKERAEYHADQLSELQYAYLQLQQDMSQVVAYQDAAAASSISTVDASYQSDSVSPKSLFQLTANQVSLIRFADPDPRYQTTPTLIRVEYVFEEGQLVRRQFEAVDANDQAVSLDSVMIKEVTEGRWQAFTPDEQPRFPVVNEGAMPTIDPKPASSQSMPQLLPKGVSVSFNYHNIPLTWQFALNAEPPHSAITPNTTPKPQ